MFQIIYRQSLLKGYKEDFWKSVIIQSVVCVWREAYFAVTC